MAACAFCDTASSISGLLISGKYSDLTIKCQGSTFYVHCAIVCPRSRVISRMVDGRFKEALTREIDFVDDELPVVKAMLHYLYNGDYDDQEDRKMDELSRRLTKKLSNGVIHSAESSASEVESSTVVDGKAAPEAEHQMENPSTGNDDEDCSIALPTKISKKINAFPLLFNTKMYIIADKNDIPSLKTLATSKYRKIVSEKGWNHPEFSEAAELLWDNTVDTDRLLRDEVIAAAVKNIHSLMDREEFVELLSDHGNLAVDIMRGVLKEKNNLSVEPVEVVETTCQETLEA